MKKILLSAAIGCFVLTSSKLWAQSEATATVCKEHSCCCGGDDPTPANVMISHIHNKKEGMLAYKYMNMDMSGILKGTETVDKTEVFNNYLMSPDKMRMDMHMLMGMYGLTDRLTLMAMLNYNKTTMNMSMFTAGGHHHGGTTTTSDSTMGHFMETSGVGDVKLSALYGLVKQPNHQLVVSAGVSVPVGSIKIQGADDDAMYPSRSYPYSMQLGSGTFDVLPSVSYLYQKDKIAFNAQMSSVIRMGYNSVGYRLGNEVSLNTWFAYQWLPFLSSSVRVEGNIADRIGGKDPSLYIYNELSANGANYGGQKVYGAIGSVLQFKKGFLKKERLSVEYALPMYQNLNGTQMKSSYYLTASMSTAF